MKNILFTFLTFFAFSELGQAQCTFEDIFPVAHGLSKFKVITSIASFKNIKENKEANRSSAIINSWNKPTYLNGDSVFKSSISYDYLYNNCFNSNKSDLYLGFVDDKLYKIITTLRFSSTQFEKCKENYNALVSMFKNKFIDLTTFTTNKSDTKEQLGEGYIFYPTTASNRDETKLNELSIGYEVEYEWFNRVQNGNVNKYVIKIEYTNLEGTKLTNKGF